ERERLGENLPYTSDKLVLYLDFSDYSNTDLDKGIVYDKSGKGNHALLRNFNYTDISGYLDDGIKLDGSDDYIEVPYSEDISLSGKDFTIEIIMKNTDNVSSGIHTDMVGGLYGAPYSLVTSGFSSFRIHNLLYFVFTEKRNSLEKIDVKAMYAFNNKTNHIVITSSITDMKYKYFINGEEF